MPGESRNHDESNTRAGARGVVEARLVDEPVAAHFANQSDSAKRRRRRKWPILLFIATCISCFWVGATHWMPQLALNSVLQPSSPYASSGTKLRQIFIRHWSDGLTGWQHGLLYMACVLAILLAHEMGHFVATLFHRVRASFPFFLPLPITPIGTLGAVIVMDNRKANRKEIFDIGIAGPIAGLVVALPIMWYGVATLDLSAPPGGPMAFESPLAVQWMLDAQQPTGYEPGVKIWATQLNPYFMAGWVGFLITGLNMMPVSQLDGGHVIYTLFGKRAHWIARGFLMICIAYMVYANSFMWLLMVILVLLIGTDHPPTKDDSVPLGWFRTTLGYASLVIPILCFAPRALWIAEL